MKQFARFTLLFLWLFAIVAPSVATLCNPEKPIVVTNLNEEEQQESGKKSFCEEKFVKENFLNFSLICFIDKSKTNDYQGMACFDHTLEVLSPPPEHTC